MTQPGHMYTKVLLLRAPNRIGKSLWAAGVYGFNKVECNVQDIRALLCIFENLKEFLLRLAVRFEPQITPCMRQSLTYPTKSHKIPHFLLLFVLHKIHIPA